jgi:hypothetical protein
VSDHLDVWAAETAALEPTEWEHWVAELKNILGHDLDGDEDHDGYSYDGFYEMWDHGLSPVAAALRTFPGRRAEFAKYEDAQRQYVQSAQAIADLATAMASGTYPGAERRSAVEAMRGHIDRLDRARDVLDTRTSEKPLQSWEEYQRSGEFMNAVLGPLPPMPEVPPPLSARGKDDQPDTYQPVTPAIPEPPSPRSGGAMFIDEIYSALTAGLGGGDVIDGEIVSVDDGPHPDEPPALPGGQGAAR